MKFEHEYLIDDLSISDLKAALDFVREDIKDLKSKAYEEDIAADKIPAYNEARKVECTLYTRLLNITRRLK